MREFDGSGGQAIAVFAVHFCGAATARSQCSATTGSVLSPKRDKHRQEDLEMASRVESLTSLERLSYAYSLVADGYESALRVPGLPSEEVESLRVFLRFSQQIARTPSLARLGEPPSEDQRFQRDG